MTTKAIIVDDEKMARVLLDGMLKQYCPEVEIVAHCIDLPSAVKAIVKYQPNLVFLDIEMPGHNGLELLDFFDENVQNFSIIFTTAYNQYAIQAFKLSAVDYLLKPIDPEDLKNAVTRFFKLNNRFENIQELKQNYTANADDQKLAVSSQNSTKYIPLKEIIFFEADGSYTTIYTTSNTKITTSKGLKYYEDLLNHNSNFMRCQKSYMINLMHVTEFIKSDGGYIVMKEAHKLPISVDKLSELNQRLHHILGLKK